MPRAAWRPGFDPGDAFGDIFGDVFGDIFGGGRRGRSQVSIAARTCATSSSSTSSRPCSATTVKVDFADARRMRASARASGSAEGAKPVTCETCRGAGQVRMQQGFFAVQQTCPRCRGRGQIDQRPLRQLPWARAACDARRRLSVKVPAGRRQRRSHPARRAKAKRGATAGRPATSTSKIRVREHAIFERDGAHLSCEVPMSFATATLGGIDRGADARRRSRRSRSRPRRSPGACSGCARRASSRCAAEPTGDLFCRVVVETPVNLTREQKELLEEFDDVAARRTRSGITRARSPGSTA